MVNTKNFQKWHQLEVSKRLGIEQRIDDQVADEMKKIRVEVKQDGKWVVVDKDALLEDAERA
jgi:hypothetical protein